MKAIILSLMSIFLVVASSHSGDIPTNKRAREAISRVKPRLIKELDRLRADWGDPIFIRIFKEERALEVWVKQIDRYMYLKEYVVCDYGPGGIGPKLKQGDRRAPEGFYEVTRSSLNPESRFHLSFNIGYPNRFDSYMGWTGGNIMVHGGCESWGCFALSDRDMEEVYALADAALRHVQKVIHVHVFPFRMTDERMSSAKGHEWESFWNNLKTGYDMFLQDGYRPPIVTVNNGEYKFSSGLGKGYQFDRTSFKLRDGNIWVIVTYVPETKDFFEPFFIKGALKDYDPYSMEYDLIINPAKQEYCTHIITILDKYQNLLQLVTEGASEWKPVADAEPGLRKMIFDVLHFNPRIDEIVLSQTVKCLDISWNCARVSRYGPGWMECYHKKKGFRMMFVRNQEELVESLCGK